MLRSGSELPALIGASRAGDQLVARLHALGRDDVAALAVGVAQQRDVRGAVRIVFDALDAAGDAFLVALEVDHAVVLLVTAALVARGDAAVVVASTGLALRLGRATRTASPLCRPRRRRREPSRGVPEKSA